MTYNKHALYTTVPIKIPIRDFDIMTVSKKVILPAPLTWASFQLRGGATVGGYAYLAAGSINPTGSNAPGFSAVIGKVGAAGSIWGSITPFAVPVMLKASVQAGVNVMAEVDNAAKPDDDVAVDGAGVPVAGGDLEHEPVSGAVGGGAVAVAWFGPVGFGSGDDACGIDPLRTELPGAGVERAADGLQRLHTAVADAAD